jgi:Fe-S cluster assembly iron-binding protein IscA
MMGMTERAAKKIRELLDAGTPETGVRIDVQGNPCKPSYRFEVVDRPAEGDYRIEEEGVRIYFDPGRARDLFNIEIDHDGSADAAGFTVRRTAPCG